MKTIRKIVTVLAVILILLTGVFLAGRYGWKLFGFSFCESAGIEAVSVTENTVHIKGFYPGSFPQGFLGYYAEEAEGKLYVGFQFSGLFGVFETGDFEIAIPVEGEITEVIVKTGQSETPIWCSEQGEAGSGIPQPAESAAAAQAYTAVIDTYYTAISERWDGQRLMDTGLNFLIRDCYGDDPLGNIGYAVTDVDGDGTMELAIGTMRGDAFYGKLIFQLYTLDGNDEPMLLFSSIERDPWYYAGGSRFANLGSSSWEENYVTTRKLEGKEMVDMTYTTDPADYVQMELIPFSQWTASAEQKDLIGWKREYVDPYTGTDATDFELKAGDVIEVMIDRVSGRLDLTIGRRGEKPIYTGNDVCSGSFTVTVPEDGEYEISVGGETVKGSVSILIQEGEG